MIRSLAIPWLVAALLWSAPALARDFDSVMTEALAAKSAGEFERVVTLLKEAYELQPSPALLNNLGRTYEELGRYGDAVKAYKGVTDDPKAPADLRSLDAGRMSMLAPKLGRVWLQTDFKPRDARLFIDGKRMDVEPKEEYDVDRGTHAIECAREASGDIVLRSERFPVSQRSWLLCDVTGRAESDAWVEIDPASSVATIDVRGYRVQTPISSKRALRLTSGEVVLDVGFADGTSRRVKTKLLPLARVQLAALLEDSEDTTATALGANLTAVAATSSGASSLPLITAVSGLVGVGVGAGLMLLADSQRAEVADAAAPAGSLDLAVGSDITEAQTHETQAEAQDNQQTGTIVLGVGAAIAIGGAVWWWMSGDAPPPAETPDEAESARRWNIGPGGLSLSRRF
jgi:hypothetical protein